MSKRVIISESQYKRVFLNEQSSAISGAGKSIGKRGGKIDGTTPKWNKHIFSWVFPSYSDYSDVPKEFIYKKNKDGSFIKKYPDTSIYDSGTDKKDYITIDDKDVRTKKERKYNDDLFKKTIKNKNDGDDFRDWVNNNPKVLKSVNNEIKRISDSDSDFNYSELDRSGDYNNEYIKIAFNKVGTQYKLQSYSDKIDTPKSDYWSSNSEKLDGLVKDLDNILKEKINNYKTTYKNSDSYKNYTKSLNNWDKVNKKFRWIRSAKNVNVENDNLDKLGDVKVSTCMNPSWVLMKKYITEEKLRLSLGTIKNNSDFSSGTNFTDMVKGKQPKPIDVLSMVDRYTDLNLHINWEDFKKEFDKIKDAEEMKSVEYFMGTKDKIKPGDPGYKLNTQLSLKVDSPSEILKKDNRKDYLSKVEKAKSIAFEKIGEDESELFLLRNNYSKILDFIDNHNKMIIGQNEAELIRVGKRTGTVSTMGYQGQIKMSEQVTVAAPLLPNITHYGDKINVYYNMRDACTNFGGVFLYYDPKEGISKTKYVCCVNNVNGKTTTISAGVGSLAALDVKGKTYPIKVKFDDDCMSENVQSWSEYLTDKSIDCVGDWHCLADVLSIVSSFFGPIGIIVGAGIDLLSGLGYFIEGDEGSKINGSLTLLGVIPGVGESMKLFKGGPKVGRTLKEIGSAVEGLDKVEAAIAIKKIVRNLDTSTKKQIENILNGFKKLEGKEDYIFNSIKNLTEEISGLSKWENDLLSKVSKELSPEEFVIQYKKYGNLKNMLSKLRVKDVVNVSSALQIGLFGGMYLGGESIGRGLANINKKYGWDPFGLFDSEGKEKKSNESYIDWDLIKKDNNLKQSIESSDIGIDLSKFGDAGDFFNGKIEETSKLMGEYQSKIEVLQKSFDDTDEIFKLLDEIKYYPYTKLPSTGINDLIKNTNKEILTFVEGLDMSKDKTKLIKELETFIKKINSVDIPKKTIYQIQLELIEQKENNERSAQKAEDLINAVKSLMQNNDNTNDDNMDLKEEINRIKKLFTNERLYGNLVNEACDDVDDAIGFLEKKGYMVKTTTEHDLCIGIGTPLGKVYKSLKTGYSGFKNFKVNVKNYGDQCGLTFKNNWNNGRFYILSLFSDMDDVNSGLFNMFYKMHSDPTKDTCPTLTMGGAKFIPSGDFNIGTTSPLQINMGLKYIKVEGKWNYDENTKKVTLKEAGVTGLFNKDVKGIKTKFATVDLSGVLKNTTGGSLEMFSIDGTTCLNTGEFVNETLGWDLSTEKDVEIILDKIK
jgi:hypothetical protein